ncbi:MAG: gliding motility-associated protein GldL [Bacteroidetes bacterium]|nr:gliding motility-associated protein GldL [Bacteroidota bacterium]
MSENQSKFDLWWNSYKIRRIVGVVYSLGASIVIVGAMGKILHTSWGGAILGVGMGVEAFLFALGALDKPHKEFDWSRIFDFESAKETLNSAAVKAPAPVATTVSAPVDTHKLTAGIDKFAESVEHLSSLDKLAASSEKLVKTFDSASESTSKFVNSQNTLNAHTESLNASYQNVTLSMDAVDKNTKSYAVRIDDINKNLSSINSLYEIQIKNIQAQSEGLNKQTESVQLVNDELGKVLTNVQKMKDAVVIAGNHTESYKSGTEKLSKQVADLNAVYGNMLNALS